MSSETGLNRCAAPASYLKVSDIAKSVHYYKDLLGFHVDMFDTGFALVSFDQVTIMLQRPPAGNPVEQALAAYIWVSDVDDYHRRFEAQGVKVTPPVENLEWGLKEFAVKDPDGHELRFGQILFSSQRMALTA